MEVTSSPRATKDRVKVTATEQTTGKVSVSGTTLYYEVRGHGPSVLCITGGAQDAGEFELLAEELADEFTVITYDRRGFSRSTPLVGWTVTSVQEHADDAAELLEALVKAPAVVFGTSSGAVILLDLIARHPQVLRGALVHEPPIIGVLPNAAEVGAQLQALIQQGLARGGPRAALELFMRTNAGDAAYESIPPDVLERVLDNAETFLQLEMPSFVKYLPDAETIATSRVPIVALASAEDRGSFLYETTRWLADRIGTEVVELPGGHAGFINHPAEAATLIRPILRTSS